MDVGDRQEAPRRQSVRGGLFIHASGRNGHRHDGIRSAPRDPHLGRTHRRHHARGSSTVPCTHERGAIRGPSHEWRLREWFARDPHHIGSPYGDRSDPFRDLGKLTKGR